MTEQSSPSHLVRSMTGFGSGSASAQDYKVEIELKSVNNRYCDINLRLPNNLRSIEPLLLEELAKHDLRGKIDIYLKFTDDKASMTQLVIDDELLQQYLAALRTFGAAAGTTLEPQSFSTHDLMQLAAYPGLLNVPEPTIDLEQITTATLAALQQALSGFLAMKAKEGEHLAQDIAQRIEKIAKMAEELAELAPQITEKYRQQLLQAVQAHLAAEAIDVARIVQETAIYSEKINYTEEVVRLRSHLGQFAQTLREGGNIGRKLDFIVQEMNREINTAAAKANSAQASKIAVAIKSELEKIKEQIQNIE